MPVNDELGKRMKENYFKGRNNNANSINYFI